MPQPLKSSNSAVETGDYLMTEHEVAALYGIKVSTFRTWRKAGIGPDCIVFTDKTIRCWRSDAIKYIERKRQKSRLKKA